MQKRFDALAKWVLDHYLRGLGAFELEKQLLAESQRIDAWFRPAEGTEPDLVRLGLLGRLAFAGPEALFEPYSSNPDADEVRDCLEKLYCLHRLLRAEARPDGPVPELPTLWVLSPGLPSRIVESWSLSASEEWGPGIYLARPEVGLNLVVLSRLPRSRDTLALRLLGRGRTQLEALEELARLPRSDPDRKAILRFLSDLRFVTLRNPAPQPAEQELIMNLHQTFEEIRASTMAAFERGQLELARAAVVEVYEERFGACPEALRARIEQTSDLELLRRWHRLAVRASATEFEAEVLGGGEQGG